MMVPGFSASVQFGFEGDYGIARKVKMAALEDITAELSKLTNDISSAKLSHGEVDFYIYKLDLLWKSIFQIHYDSNVDSNSFNDTLILFSINEAILCLKECNRLLDSAYRCPVEHTGNVGRPRLSVTIDQLEYFIDYDFSATDIAHMLNISVRTIQRRLQDFDLSIRASYSPVKAAKYEMQKPSTCRATLFHFKFWVDVSPFSPCVTNLLRVEEMQRTDCLICLVWLQDGSITTTKACCCSCFAGFTPFDEQHTVLLKYRQEDEYTESVPVPLTLLPSSLLTSLEKMVFRFVHSFLISSIRRPGRSMLKDFRFNSFNCLSLYSPNLWFHSSSLSL